MLILIKTGDALKLSTVKQAKQLLEKISQKNELYYESTKRLFISLNTNNQKESQHPPQSRITTYRTRNTYLYKRVRSKSAKTT